MAEDSGEKTEQATDARREEFRKQGNVAHTKELGSAVILLAAAGGVYALGRFFFKNLFDIFNYSFGQNMVTLIRSGNFTDAMRFSAEKGVILIAPVMGIAGVLGVATTIMQTG
ncbi:MAG: EscU/YscU/HrcU family type III secretion system export apparatus switch protein, partial [Pseudobdellovibrionaceae bacterium]